jgi:hypothetical protein
MGRPLVFRWLPLARQLPRSQRFSGLIAALKLAKYGNDLMSVLSTAFAARELESPPEIEIFLRPCGPRDFGTLDANSLYFND